MILLYDSFKSSKLVVINTINTVGGPFCHPLGFCCQILLRFLKVEKMRQKAPLLKGSMQWLVKAEAELLIPENLFPKLLVS